MRSVRAAARLPLACTHRLLREKTGGLPAPYGHALDLLRPAPTWLARWTGRPESFEALSEAAPALTPKEYDTQIAGAMREVDEATAKLEIARSPARTYGRDW